MTYAPDPEPSADRSNNPQKLAIDRLPVFSHPLVEARTGSQELVVIVVPRSSGIVRSITSGWIVSAQKSYLVTYRLHKVRSGMAGCNPHQLATPAFGFLLAISVTSPLLMSERGVEYGGTLGNMLGVTPWQNLNLFRRQVKLGRDRHCTALEFEK